MPELDGDTPADTDTELVSFDPADTDALRAWATAATSVFLSPRPTDEDVALRQERFAGHRLTAARDAGATVGTFRSYDTHLDVPGGRVPVNAISSITVLPTHRRRGLLTRWMTDDLGRAASAGSVASILVASEAPIYGRFGFGTATRACTWTVDARTAHVLRPPEGRVEIVSPEVFAGEAPAVYEAARRRQPGAIDRTPLWWRTTAQLRPPQAGVDRHRLHALHRAPDGTVDGALSYRVTERWTERVSTSRLEVADLVAASTSAYADLWRYCFDVDFVTEVRAEDRSPDEALPWLLSDPRSARSGPVADFLWVRLHDVPAALTERRYPTAGALTLAVEEGGTTSTVRLNVAADGTATCVPTALSAVAQPDVRLGVDTLASLWLGGARAGVLRAAGRLDVRDERTSALADSLFSWPDPAWCGTWF